MSKLTKADIDGLVEAMDRVQSNVPWSEDELQPGLQWRRPLDLRTALYLAAGLTSTGERKPERVRLHRYTYDDGRPTVFSYDEIWGSRYYRHTPGWFVPDGAE